MALDREIGVLTRARERARFSRVANIRFVESDLEARDLPAGPFDAVVGRRVLMYLSAPVRALERLAQLVKAGGLLVFQESDSARIGTSSMPRYHALLHERLWRTIRYEGGNPHIGLALAPMFRAAGLRVEGLQVEAAMLLPEVEKQVAEIGSAMIPRMVAAGVVEPREVDPDVMRSQLRAERAASAEPLSWETILGIWGSVLGRDAGRGTGVERGVRRAVDDAH